LSGSLKKYNVLELRRYIPSSDTEASVMRQVSRISRPYQPTGESPLLSQRLLKLSRDASRAGYPVAAEHLLYLAEIVLDPPDDRPVFVR
jgi:hypothetical protein